MRAFIGVDSGTQSCKALVVDTRGNVLGRGQSAHRSMEGLPPGHSEQDPRGWVAAMVAAIREGLASSGLAASDIIGIGVSGQQHGFVPLDARGDVIRPAKLWNDTSTEAEAQHILASVGGAERYRSLTGNLLPPGYTASKILWLKRSEPEHFARLHTVLLPHDYLNFWLTGERTMEWGDASGTGLMDVSSRKWIPEIVDAIDGRLGRCLPELRDSAAPAGRLCAEAAAELGLSQGTVVSAGGGDNMMGAIGTGVVSVGRTTISLGTSGTIYAYSPTPVIDPQGEVAAFCDSTGGWLPLVCTMHVTASTEMVRTMFGLSVEALESAASKAPTGSDGLMLLPYLQGERIPNIPAGTGVWIGASALTQDASHYARAAMEGATLGLNHGFKRLVELGIAPRELVITGGGSRSATWRRIAANVFGLPIRSTSEPEGAALGAALQSMWCWHREHGEGRSIQEIAGECVYHDPSMTVEPDDAGIAVYKELQAIHDAASVALRGTFREHRKFLGRA